MADQFLIFINSNINLVLLTSTWKSRNQDVEDLAVIPFSASGGNPSLLLYRKGV